MTFGSREASRHLGEPVELYRFIYGPNGESYCYTDAVEPITVPGIGPAGADLVFEPVPIDRPPLTSSGTLDKASLEILIAIDTDIAEIFRVYPPSQVVGLIILEHHIGDTEFPVVWTGRVLSCAGEEDEAKLTCEPVQTSLKRPGLRRHYQYGCPHALYRGIDGRPGCHASKAAATETGTVALIEGNKITLDAGWHGARPPAKFLGGTLEWTTAEGAREIRSILRVAVDTLTLSGLVRNLEATDTVDVVLGCSRQMDDCENLHDVLPDYGGQPWIPLRNPFGVVNNYY